MDSRILTELLARSHSMELSKYKATHEWVSILSPPEVNPACDPDASKTIAGPLSNGMSQRVSAGLSMFIALAPYSPILSPLQHEGIPPYNNVYEYDYPINEITSHDLRDWSSAHAREAKHLVQNRPPRSPIQNRTIVSIEIMTQHQRVYVAEIFSDHWPDRAAIWCRMRHGETNHKSGCL